MENIDQKSYITITPSETITLEVPNMHVLQEINERIYFIETVISEMLKEIDSLKQEEKR